jgi:hypothetical protein
VDLESFLCAVVPESSAEALRSLSLLLLLMRKKALIFCETWLLEPLTCLLEFMGRPVKGRFSAMAELLLDELKSCVMAAAGVREYQVGGTLSLRGRATSGRMVVSVVGGSVSTAHDRDAVLEPKEWGTMRRASGCGARGMLPYAGLQYTMELPYVTLGNDCGVRREDRRSMLSPRL